MSRRRVVVLGAGPAGLASAVALRARGIEVTLLDRAGSVGANWRTRYDGLRLNTVRWLSHLPGHRMPSRMGRWVGRDDFVEYLERYAAHHRLDIQSAVDVRRIDSGPGGDRRWLLSTDAGEIAAPAVVVATGAFDVPVTPQWPGAARFKGDLRHASRYQNPQPYLDRTVLVVGCGASGLEISALLSQGGAAKVYLSVRSCQNLFVRQWCGIPLTPMPVAQRLPTPVLDVAGKSLQRLLGADWPSPLPRPAAGLGQALRRDGAEPVVADRVVEALRAGRITLVPGVADFADDGVLLYDGSALHPDAVIAATGFTHSLDKLVGHLPVLDDTGLPISPAGEPVPTAPGLAFVGFLPTVTGRLLRIPTQAREAAKSIAAALDGS